MVIYWGMINQIKKVIYFLIHTTTGTEKLFDDYKFVKVNE